MEIPNVYIFNKIKQNYADIKLLRSTFGLLGCIVEEVNNAYLETLKTIVKQIVATDFSKFNYVVIIILDNTNNEQGIWTTTDGQNFHINGDLLVALYANRSLKGKLRLGIIQTNRDLKDSDPVLRDCEGQTTNLYPLIDVKFFATSPGLQLKHIWQKEQTSPFIRILCEEFIRALHVSQRIDVILNSITTRVEMETGELPAKEMGIDSCIFGHALS